MRKQQLRMASGGAVVRARKGGARSRKGVATSVAGNGDERPVAGRGGTPGDCGFSTDWFPCWQCAWHKPGAGAFPSHSSTGFPEALVLGAESILGQAYAATASCMKSTSAVNYQGRSAIATSRRLKLTRVSRSTTSTGSRTSK